MPCGTSTLGDSLPKGEFQSVKRRIFRIAAVLAPQLQPDQYTYLNILRKGLKDKSDRKSVQYPTQLPTGHFQIIIEPKLINVRSDRRVTPTGRRSHGMLIGRLDWSTNLRKCPIQPKQERFLLLVDA